MDHEDTQTDYSLASSLNELAGTLGSTLTEEEQEAQLMESKISSLRETLNEMASKTREGLYNPFDSDGTSVQLVNTVCTCTCVPAYIKYIMYVYVHSYVHVPRHTL